MCIFSNLCSSSLAASFDKCVWVKVYFSRADFDRKLLFLPADERTLEIPLPCTCKLTIEIESKLNLKFLNYIISLHLFRSFVLFIRWLCVVDIVCIWYGKTHPSVWPLFATVVVGSKLSHEESAEARAEANKTNKETRKKAISLGWERRPPPRILWRILKKFLDPDCYPDQS